MSGARHRRKGNRVERELVQLHKALGVHAERYPLSGGQNARHGAGRSRPLAAVILLAVRIPMGRISYG